jgi:uncharacterized protein with PQ loop repeat
MNLLLNLLAVSATVLGSGMALPQARRIARTRRIEGISATWIGVSVAINGWWIAYAVAAQIWVLLPVSIISVALYLTIGVFFVATVGRSAVPGLVIGSVGLGMVPLPFLVGGGWALAGLAVGLCYGLQLLPAVIAACRTRALAGISSATWIIAWVEAVLWLGYGIGVVDAALIAGGAIGTAMATVILVRLAATGHRPMRVLRARFTNRQRLPMAATHRSLTIEP